MKIKKLLIWSIIGFLILGVFYYKPLRISADSGWDASYDGGDWSSDSWDSWSSWGSDWSSDNHYYSSSSSSGGDSSIMGLIYFIIIIILLVMISNNRVKSKTAISNNYEEVSDDILNKYGINRKEFEQMVYDKYISVQNDWSNFNYSGLQKTLTDELYNTYMMQLDALKLKKQKNIMSDFDLIECKIIDVKDEHGLLNVNTYLRVTMYDYVVDENNNILRGNKSRKIDIEYVITMIKTKGDIKETMCPNCGANIEAVASGKCSYCGSTIVVDAKDFVMSKKTCVGQRLR